jgi:hypothetical protein
MNTAMNNFLFAKKREREEEEEEWLEKIQNILCNMVNQAQFQKLSVLPSPGLAHGLSFYRPVMYTVVLLKVISSTQCIISWCM